MNANEISDWSDQYDEVYNEKLRNTEERIHKTINEQQYLTRDELLEIVRWKLDGMPGRRGGNVDRVESVPNEFVQRVTEAALLIDDPVTQLKTLKSIPGIGPATGTVILTFYDPEHYGIGDRYILDEFFGEPRTIRVTDYPKILEELQTRNPGEFNLRTVEKAYYQKYRVENEVGNFSRNQ
jgi:hypothetical protein